MMSTKGSGIIFILVIVLCLTIPALANPDPDYTITYTIAIHADGSAAWTVEYRTPLPTAEEKAAFEQGTGTTSVISPDDIRHLMERSAAESAAATGRAMEIRDFAAGSVVQSSPTGTYGVVHYSFLWTGFAKPGDGLTVGDTFSGGLYLPKEATLILRVPDGYSVASTDPAPDLSRENDLIWYGLRSFGAGEPRVAMTPTGFPFLLVLLPVGFLGIVILGGFLVFRRLHAKRLAAEGPAIPAITEVELANVEERILALLRESGGEMYQSEIVQRLGLPKSTVSSALNALHGQGTILKIRKGRENLIRLA